MLPTPVFFYGMEPGEEISVDIEPGKTLIIKFLTVGDPHPDGTPHGLLRAERPAARGRGASTGSLASSVREAAEGRAGQPAPGRRADAGPGGRRRRRRRRGGAAGQKLFTLEAMKMETTLYAERPGRVAEVLAKKGRRWDGRFAH